VRGFFLWWSARAFARKSEIVVRDRPAQLPRAGHYPDRTVREQRRNTGNAIIIKKRWRSVTERARRWYEGEGSGFAREMDLCFRHKGVRDLTPSVRSSPDTQAGRIPGLSLIFVSFLLQQGNTTRVLDGQSASSSEAATDAGKGMFQSLDPTPDGGKHGQWTAQPIRPPIGTPSGRGARQV